MPSAFGKKTTWPEISPFGIKAVGWKKFGKKASVMLDKRSAKTFR